MAERDDAPQVAQQAVQRQAPATLGAHLGLLDARAAQEARPAARGRPAVLRDVRLGTVVAAPDTQHHRVLMECDLPEGPVLVRYWPVAPAVGDRYPVRFAHAQEPWMRTHGAGGTIRWLYYRQADATGLALRRIRWPLTAVPLPAPQVVQTPFPFSISDRLAFVGWHAPTASLVESATPWTRFGSVGEAALPADGTVVTRYGAWGTAAGAATATGRTLRVGGVAPDSASLAPTACALTAQEPVATILHWGVVDTSGPVDTAWRLVSTADGGATWGVLGTYEYKRQVESHAFPGFAGLPAGYPLMTRPVFVQGVTLDGALALPVALLTLTDFADTDDLTTYPPLYSVTWSTVRGSSLTPEAWSLAPALLGSELQHGIGQRADGTLAYYVRVPTGAPSVSIFGTWTAPNVLARGDGVATLAWTYPPAASDVAPYAVSMDGQALIGTRGLGRDSRVVVSDDYGVSWAVAPTPWDGTDDDISIGNDFLLVDIPTSDPRAVELAA